LQRAGLVQLGRRDGARLREDFAQPHGVFGQGHDQIDVFRDLAVGRQDVQQAGIAHEIEHPFDLLLAGVGAEIDLEAEIAGFRVHRLVRRHGIDQAGEMGDLAEAGEVAQEGQRVHAFAQHVLAEADGDMPAIVADHAAAAAFQVRVGCAPVRRRPRRLSPAHRLAGCEQLLAARARLGIGPRLRIEANSSRRAIWSPLASSNCIRSPSSLMRPSRNRRARSPRHG
jgi:hypothetical protein